MAVPIDPGPLGAPAPVADALGGGAPVVARQPAGRGPGPRDPDRVSEDAEDAEDAGGERLRPADVDAGAVAAPDRTGPAGLIPVGDRLARQEARVAELERQLAELHAAATDTNADDEHDPEGATLAFERQLLASLLDRARATAAALQAAIGRDGEISCERCGRPIPAERLAVRPQATRCVPCAQRS